jgi:hypothetical protein
MKVKVNDVARESPRLVRYIGSTLPFLRDLISATNKLNSRLITDAKYKEVLT